MSPNYRIQTTGDNALILLVSSSAPVSDAGRSAAGMRQ